MQSTSSVAQGSFLFLPDGFSLSKLKKSRKRKATEVTEDKWEKGFKKIWEEVHQEIKKINEKLFSKVLEDLIEHMKKLPGDDLDQEVIPCEILLTGTNLPDHKLLLSTFINDVNQQITPYSASLWSWNCGNIKSTVQNLVSQIIPISKYRKKAENNDGEFDDDEETDVDENHPFDDSPDGNGIERPDINIQSSQCNFSILSSWYSSECKRNEKRKPIVVIIPDFESFQPNVLGEFILLLSTYASKIPFILVFGVATTPVAVYQNLSRKVLSQLVIQLFRSEPSTSLLNNVIENVLFSDKCPFRLGNKCMSFLTDIFLFHSFSVHGFIQGFKFCLMEHFYRQNHFILCCEREQVEENVNSLTEAELENIRKTVSFQKFVENSEKEERKALLLDDSYTRTVVTKMVKELLAYTRVFHFALKILHIFTSDLPTSPLGRNVREYYCKCVSDNVIDSKEYKECMRLLDLQSQSELTQKVDSVIKYLRTIVGDDNSAEENEKMKALLKQLQEFRDSFDKLEMKPSEGAEVQVSDKTEFEVLKKTFLEYVEEKIVKELLNTPTSLPLHEIIYFDDLAAVRRRISGSPRGAIHLALNNPQCYLNCKCCVVSNTEVVLSTLPDLAIAYKIHLECNKMINMYDWLQSFAAIVKSDNSKVEEDVDQEIQARFTRAVSELQFLGFIKPSRAKTDHVMRLTWGNS